MGSQEESCRCVPCVYTRVGKLLEVQTLLTPAVVKEKNLIWISFLLEVDVYFQNIALAALAEAIYCLQRGS